MESVLSNYEEGKNFWKLYPSYKAPKLYKQLYNEDKSKSKSASSNLMWALHFMFDKSEFNMWAKYDSDDRIGVINEDILGNVNFDWNKYAALLEYAKHSLLDEMDRMYYSLVDKMDQRSKLLKDAVYTLESAKTIDETFLRTDKLREELRRMKDALAGKDSAGRGKGGLQESAAEKGEI